MSRKILILIIGLAACLRLWHLGTVPPHLTNDEAALGYNAYSILTTGRDEHGELFPVVFKSFGDWKPGLYIYSAIPSIATLGLNEFSVRLPSAVAGIIAVYLLYLIVNKLFQDHGLALFSSFLLAISPWHLQFSRGAWEANLALTLLLAGIYFFICAINTKSSHQLAMSATFFGLTLWTYQSAKLASLIVLGILVMLYYKELFSFNKKGLLPSVLIGVLLTVPIIMSIRSGKAGRIEVMSVFSYRRSPEYIQETIYDQDNVPGLGLSYYLFHSEAYNLARGVLGRYFNHFSGRVLFFEGDWTNPRHAPPYMGYIYVVFIPLLAGGLAAVARALKDRNIQLFVLWLVFAPVPSALTRDSVHGVRSLNLLIPLCVITAIGAVFLWKKAKTVFIKKHRLLLGLLLVTFVGLTIGNFIYYLDAYYIHLPAKNSQYYQYGYKQVVQDIIGSEDKYQKIIFAQSYDQPYIYFLFYGAQSGVAAYRPDNFQNSRNFVDSQIGDVGQVKTLGKIEYRIINWPTDRNMHGSLIVGTQYDFPLSEIASSNLYDIKTVKYLNGDTAFASIYVK